MLNYVRAELYKVIHRKYLYIFLAVMLPLEGLMVAFFALMESAGGLVDLGSALVVLGGFMTLGVYLALLFVDPVFSDQYKFGTLKNEISFGITRTRIYLGKLLVELITAVVVCAVMLVFYVGLCWIFLPHTGNEMSGLQSMGYYLMVSLPLWVGGIGFGNAIFFHVKNNTVASFTFAGMIVVLAPMCRLIGALELGLVSHIGQILYKMQLNAPFDVIGAEPDWAIVGWALTIGLGWFIGSTAVGVLLFRKKEIS